MTALETAGSGITCNAVCPGWVLTPREFVCLFVCVLCRRTSNVREDFVILGKVSPYQLLQLSKHRLMLLPKIKALALKKLR